MAIKRSNERPPTRGGLPGQTELISSPDPVIEPERDPIEFADTDSHRAVIKVIGVGGGGGNALNNMVLSGLSGLLRCGKMEKSTTPSMLSPSVGGFQSTKSSPMRGVSTMLPALSPT